MDSETLLQDEAANVFRESLREFERCGFSRPSTASLSEYLDALVDADVLPRDDADLFVSVYHALRYGQQANDDRLQRAVEKLHAAAQLLKEMNSGRREQISRQLQKRFAPSEVPRPIEFAGSLPVNRPAPTGETSFSVRIEPEYNTTPLEPQDVRAVSAAETSRWSQRRHVIAYGTGALFWTIAVLVGGNFWHDDISLLVRQAKVSLGWDDPRDTQQPRRNWSVTENRSPAPSEFEVMMHRAKVLDRSNETRLALNAYELALRLDPNHAEANNNLAWMLLTSEDTSLRDPIRALPLAKQAVLIESNATYLDTLAEAWYQNGDPAQAVELEEKAWSLEQKSALDRKGPPNPFLKKQLEKFRQALRDPSTVPVVAGEASSANGVQTVPQNENKLPAGSPPATTRVPNASPAAIPPTPADSPSPPPLPE